MGHTISFPYKVSQQKENEQYSFLTLFDLNSN